MTICSLNIYIIQNGDAWSYCHMSFSIIVTGLNDCQLYSDNFLSSSIFWSISIQTKLLSSSEVFHSIGSYLIKGLAEPSHCYIRFWQIYLTPKAHWPHQHFKIQSANPSSSFSVPRVLDFSVFWYISFSPRRKHLTNTGKVARSEHVQTNPDWRKRGLSGMR